MSSTNLICILCPMSCQLVLTIEDGQVTKVEGNSCKLGQDYAAKEYTCPMRTLTGTVALENGVIARLPVKTAGEIPKTDIEKCIQEILKTRVSAPVVRGQVIIPDVAGTGISVVATRSIERL